MSRFRVRGEAPGKCVARRSETVRTAAWAIASGGKAALRLGAPDHTEISIRDDLTISLGELRQHALRTARGQKIAYVVDLAYEGSNAEKVVALAREADSSLSKPHFSM